MLRTRVGYCGGKKENPTYYSLGDQTEAISIDFDPKVISYEQLLAYFWTAHRCDQTNRSRQYMNAVFYQNEHQQQIAANSKAAEAKKKGIPLESVQTEILPVRTYTYAEGYHQKYYLRRHSDIVDFILKTYPDAKSKADSTVATRINAYLGTGMQKDWKVFIKELPKYGLPEAIEKRLAKDALKQH